MNPFAVLWATFLTWYHDPSRILGSFDRIQRRLNAASTHHSEQSVRLTALAKRLEAEADTHYSNAVRASNVSSKLAELLT